MKAVVARHFTHSWVLSWAPGHLADVSLNWQRYRAARNALSAAVTPGTAKDLAARHAGALPLHHAKAQGLLHALTKVCTASNLM